MIWVIGAAAVVVLYLYSRRAGIVAVAVLAVLYVGLWLMSGQINSKVPTNQSVAVVAGSGGETCKAPGAPVSVTFTNNADRQLLATSFTLSARQAGHSSLIYRATLRSDKIIEPGGSWTECYGLNPLSFSERDVHYNPSDLEWSAEVSLSRFASS
ncbi:MULTISPECIES: hypothetical protein [unclassified Rhizobium]|uniref:hypothetical protein n=1 Tax=unclassified Rhizobium TaxID=2613769 RepID=UPI001AE66C49|nr:MULTISPECIES: hypothetical protein [unclassified Rhizobium]MBP2462047.1 hypothetical protein [Rhizobium sp. PvP014]MBP2529443.1 hypothetical protein [Rhizobium sp. PvP099]